MPQAKSSTCSSALLLLVVLAAACSNGSPAQPLSPVVGAVVDIRGSGVLTVDSFRLRTQSQQELDFRVGTVDLASGGFPPAHLREHQATGQLVKVTFHREGGVLVATRLEDG